MNHDEADELPDRRKEEQPLFERVIQRRAGDDSAALRATG
jgi:hypothetical protein